MLRFTIAQINPTIGDVDGNIELMRSAAAQAAQDQSKLVIFPELSLTGYYPADLLDEPAFLKHIELGLTALIEHTRATPDLHWVIGAPTARAGVGKRLQNSLLVLKNGKVVMQYAKQLLPTYNIFDEQRHFEPGPDVGRVLRIDGAQVGFFICEDGWNDEGEQYEVNPFQRLADAAPDMVISINASPSNVDKREQRHSLFSEGCKRHDLPLLYVNQVGGHDQLVFDGASFAVNAQGEVVFEAKRFETEVVTLNFDGKTFFSKEMGTLPPVNRKGLPTSEFYRQQAILGLRDYARRCGFKGVLVGSSGGIDSALTLALATDAMGAENVIAVTMPSHHSSAGSVNDSVTLCKNLGVKLFEHPIRQLVDDYAKGFEDAFGQPLKGLALENVQARIRGTILMEYSNSYGHLLLTTGNKSEVSVGYCTLYGDTNGGLNLIGDLYKTEVFALSRHINERAGREIIPNVIIEKEPSAELAPNQRDVDSLPPYPILDDILKSLIEGDRLTGHEREAVSARLELLARDEEGRGLIRRIKRLMAQSEYKRRQCPPILRMRSRAFGSGRQMPIAARHELGS